MITRAIMRGLPLVVIVLLAGVFLTSSGVDAGVTRTYVVLYRGNTATGGAELAVNKAGGSVAYSYRQIGVVIARSSSDTFAQNLKKDSRVEGVSATEAFKVKLESDLDGSATAAAVEAVATAGFPDDSLGGLQWDMEQINAVEAQAINDGDSSVVVGDIDTGLDYHHPDLAANVDFSRSVSCVSGVPDTTPAAWDDHNGHGTHTAGTIAAAANGIGIIGVAPGVKIAGIKGGNDDGYFFPEAVICSFMWAGNNGIDVTNNSYFADPWLFNCRNDAEQRAIWKAERRAIEFAISRGVTVVASAGNENMDLSKHNIDEISPDFPPGSAEEREVNNACAVVPVEVPGVIGVTANGDNGDKSFYSSYGVGAADVVAPGGDSFQITAQAPNGRVLSTWPAELIGALPPSRIVVDGGAVYAYLQGTSMAGPHAAGVAALILSVHPNIGANAVGALLQESADPQACPPNPYDPPPGGFEAFCVGGPAHNGFYGHGEINAEAAVGGP